MENRGCYVNWCNSVHQRIHYSKEHWTEEVAPFTAVGDDAVDYRETYGQKYKRNG